MYKKALLALALAGAVASAQAVVLLNEGFDNISTLAGSGWVMNNASTPVGSTGWYQGDDTIFGAQSGAAESYIAANYNNSVTDGTINNWLITPTFSTEFASTMTFWIRGGNDDGFSDNFMVRLSQGGSNLIDFTLTTQLIEASKDGWVGWQVGYGAQGAGKIGRFAFLYTGDQNTSNYLGVDSVTITNNTDVPEPSIWVMLGTGLLGLFALRRRQKN
jgi:hypothetical protein